jgi:hypothetical protein
VILSRICFFLIAPDQIIQSVVKKRKISLLDLDESELSDFCPDSSDAEFTVRGQVQSPGQVGKEGYATSLG